LAELVRVEDGPAEPYPLALKSPTKERLFDPSHVHHHHSSGHRDNKWLDRFIERRRFGEIDHANPVDEYRLLRQLSSGPAQPVQSATDDDAAGIDRHGGE
jgi:hypothetical protein